MEELIGLATAAVGRNRNVPGCVNGLRLTSRLSANEEARVLLGALEWIRKIPFAGQVRGQIARQQTVSHRKRFGQPGFEPVAVGTEADQELTIHVVVFRITIIEYFVFRKSCR